MEFCCESVPVQCYRPATPWSTLLRSTAPCHFTVWCSDSESEPLRETFSTLPDQADRTEVLHRVLLPASPVWGGMHNCNQILTTCIQWKIHPFPPTPASKEWCKDCSQMSECNVFLTSNFPGSRQANSLYIFPEAWSSCLVKLQNFFTQAPSRDPLWLHPAMQYRLIYLGKTPGSKESEEQVHTARLHIRWLSALSLPPHFQRLALEPNEPRLGTVVACSAAEPYFICRKLFSCASCQPTQKPQPGPCFRN